MIDLDRLLAALSDAKLAGLMARRGPAWALRPEGTVALANVRGLAALGGRAEALGQALPERASLRRELDRLVKVLPRGGETRLERLRLPGARFTPVTTACHRLPNTALGDLVTIASLEDGGDRNDSPAEIARLIAAIVDAPVLVADGSGKLLAWSREAAALVGGASTLHTLSADAPAWIADAAAGAAERLVAGQRIALQGLMLGGAQLLLGWLKPAPAAVEPVPAPIAEASREPEPAPEPLAKSEPEAKAEPAPVAEPAQPSPAQASEQGPEPELEPESATEAVPAPEALPESDAGQPAAPEKAVSLEDQSPETGSRKGEFQETAPKEAELTPSQAPAMAATDMSSVASKVSGSAKLPPARRLPLRFVWQTDAAGRLTQVSSELAEAVGDRSADVIGQSLADLSARLGFDADGRIGRALAKHDTWSGVNVTWPTDFGDFALVDLAGLPVFDRARMFQGYRGFGVCRALRASATVVAAAEPTETVAEPASTDTRTSAKVVPLRAPEPAKSAQFQDQPAKPAHSPDQPAKSPTEAANPALSNPALSKPALSAGERVAFREIGRMLGSPPAPVSAESAPATAPAIDLEPATPTSVAPTPAALIPAAPPPEPTEQPAALDAPTVPEMPEPAVAVRAVANGERAVLERLPLGVLVYGGERMLFANPALLEWLGLQSIEDIERAGGLDAVFDVSDLAGADSDAKALSVRGAGGLAVPVEARLFSAPWQGETAIVLVLRRTDTTTDERIRMLELALRTAEAQAREAHAILDTATDGVVITDRDGRILGVNGAAEALFGYDGSELVGRSFGLLFAPESQRAAFDYIDGLLRGGVASVLNDGREVIGRVREGGLIPLFMTMGRVTEDGSKFCAVFRDITQWKRAEDELVAARQAAEQANSHKSDFLAKISHEIRTPLNAIIGFSEVMMEERFGPVGNPRYKDYLKDIHTSGAHVVSLVNDLLDLSKIEAGKLDLDFVSVDLNDVLVQCMALMQPQANRERIIIRTSLAPRLPPVVADARSMKQVVLNLLSNSIRFTQPGGQVILSTALSDGGEVVMRVRDTGVGMSEADIAAALEPFRQITTSSRGPRGDGTGLGLPLTKALVEANRASFAIRSSVNAGTMVEVIFPPTRVLAE
jgi:PAS domain S-box-containing protein